jgi:superfamily II DNA or RNA helicase
MATFKTRAAPAPTAENPERLFDNLPRTSASAPSLWAHQADMLRSYVDAHVETADLALELPTGAGKTLPALLIAEWRRTSFQERAAYACPTV